MREQCWALRRVDENLPVGPVVLTAEPPASLEDSQRVIQGILPSPYLQHRQRSRFCYLFFIDQNSYNRWSQPKFPWWWLLGWESSPGVHTVLKEQLSYPGKISGWSKTLPIVVCHPNEEFLTSIHSSSTTGSTLWPKSQILPVAPFYEEILLQPYLCIFDLWIPSHYIRAVE